MGRSFRKLAALVLVAWGGFWATPPPARADFALQMSVDGQASTLGILTDVGQMTPGVIQYSGSVSVGSTAYFNLAFTYATSNSPGDSNGIVTIANTRITNLTGSAHTLTIAVSSTGFATPGVDQLYSTMSGSVTRYSATGSFTSYVDLNNGLFVTSNPSDPSKVINAPTLAFSAAALTPNASFSGTSISDTFGASNADGSPIVYSITNVSNYTIAGGGSLTLSGGNSETVAPAPSGMVLALSGVPLLGLGCWLRRRRSPVLAT